MSLRDLCIEICRTVVFYWVLWRVFLRATRFHVRLGYALARGH